MKRAPVALLALACAIGCKKKQDESDAAALAALFAAPDAGPVAADAGREASAETAAPDEPLLQLKPHRVGTVPSAAAPRSDAGRAQGTGSAAPSGNPNAPGCEQARQFCAMNRTAMCVEYTERCMAAGGRL